MNLQLLRQKQVLKKIELFNLYKIKEEVLNLFFFYTFLLFEAISPIVIPIPIKNNIGIHTARVAENNPTKKITPNNIPNIQINTFVNAYKVLKIRDIIRNIKVKIVKVIISCPSFIFYIILCKYQLFIRKKGLYVIFIIFYIKLIFFVAFFLYLLYTILIVRNTLSIKRSLLWNLGIKMV